MRPGNARTDILAALRGALEKSGPAAPPDTITRDYRLSGDAPSGSAEVVAELVEALEDYTAEVFTLTADEVGDRIAAVLAERGAQTVAVPEGLEAQWREACAREGREMRVDSAAAPLTKEVLNATDAVVTGAATAVSSTGMICLDGAADQGRRVLTLLPDLHVCVLAASHVHPTVPQAIAELEPHATRPQTWFAGPSATSDIELVRVDGVHGPRRLVVLIVTDH